MKCCGNRILACALHCRPPHGGRGLKFMIGYMQPETDEVAPRTGGVDWNQFFCENIFNNRVVAPRRGGVD